MDRISSEFLWPSSESDESLNFRGATFVLQEAERLRAKQAKEDLEEFLLNHEEVNSTLKYR